MNLFSALFLTTTSTTEIYTLSLHDALPISGDAVRADLFSLLQDGDGNAFQFFFRGWRVVVRDRKSTRLNSSHEWISYAVFCLKKKKLVAPCNVLEVNLDVSAKKVEVRVECG